MGRTLSYGRGIAVVTVKKLKLEKNAGGTYRKEGAISDYTTLALSQLSIVDKGACVAVSIAKDVTQLPVLITTDVDDAVEQVDTGIVGMYADGDGIALLIAPNGVVAHLESYLLLVVKFVLDDDNRAQLTTWRIDAYGKLPAALLTAQHKRLPCLILGLVEGDGLVALWTTYALHLTSMIHVSRKRRLSLRNCCKEA